LGIVDIDLDVSGVFMRVSPLGRHVENMDRSGSRAELARCNEHEHAAQTRTLLSSAVQTRIRSIDGLPNI
jgi:hypothetical protein